MKVLIIRVSAIGDVFLTSQLAQYVKIAMPDAEVTWIVEGRCSAVLKGNPYIDKIIEWKRDKKKGIKGLFESSNEITSKLTDTYDIVLDVQCLLKLAPIITKLKKKKVVGLTDYEIPMNLFYNQMVKTEKFERLSEKYLRVAQTVFGYKGGVIEPYLAHTDKDKEKASKYWDDNNLNSKERVIGCVFATSRYFKYWQKEKWAQFADIAKEKYNAKCLLFGAPTDKEDAKELMSMSDNFISIVGETSILETMAFLEKCNAVVATDTALMHFSTILNVPTVCLYGTNVFFSHHIGRENVEIVYKGDYNNKTKKVPPTKCFENMNQISVEEVVSSLDKFLK